VVSLSRWMSESSVDEKVSMTDIVGAERNDSNYL
jgi:hypothetical protein